MHQRIMFESYQQQDKTPISTTTRNSEHMYIGFDRSIEEAEMLKQTVTCAAATVHSI
jgi:hypothetical protein